MANKRISELSSRTPSATDLMLIGDPTTGYSYKCTLLETIGLGVPATRTITINGTTFDLSANRTWNVGTVTSVGLSMPSAFAVSGSPVTNNGTLTVTAAGTASQYIRGDGQLATLPTGGGGGGASVSYYLNGSVSQGTFGGTTYYEVNKTPVLGTGTNFTTSSNGYIASFITDAGDPGSLLIPGGNWNFEVFFAASSGGGTPTYYVELYKYDGTTFSLIASSSANPDVISGGTAVEAYFSTLAVPETALAITDRLAIRIYVTTAGRTITLHTEDNNLCQIVTTFSTGITALNGLTKQVQYFATGTTGTDFGIVSSNDTHTFNLPSSSATNRGLLTAADWTTFNGKQNALNGTGFVRMTGTTVSYVTGTSSQFVKADGTLDSSVYVTSNIYTADGTLTGNRTVTSGGFTLTFTGNVSMASTAGNAVIGSGTVNSLGSYTVLSVIGRATDQGGVLKLATSNLSNDSLIFIDSGGLSFRTSTNDQINFQTNGNNLRMRIFAGGNIGINTTTDAGFRLDVNGTMRVQGNTTLSNGATLQINNVGNTVGSTILYASTPYRGESLLFQWGGGNVFGYNATGLAMQNISTNNDIFFINRSVLSQGASGGSGLELVDGGRFSPTTGTNTYNAFSIRTRYNSTGGTNTIRGIFYNPTIESLTGATHIAIQTVTGDVLLGTTSGNVGIGTTSPTYKLHTVGTGRITGNVELSVDSGAYTIIGATGDTTYRLSVDGDLRVYGSVRTANPSGGTSTKWRLGSYAAATVQLDTSGYLEVEVNGTAYKVGLVMLP